MAGERDKKGRFQKGCAAGPGRPRGAGRVEYLEALREGCPPDKWARIVARAVADATKGDAEARRFIERRLLGDSGIELLAVEAGGQDAVGNAAEQLLAGFADNQAAQLLEWLQSGQPARDVRAKLSELSAPVRRKLAKLLSENADE